MSVADPWWDRLVEVLGAAGAVTEPPGRIRVEIGGHSVEVVMTPSDWDSWAGTVNGSLEYTAALVLAEVRAAADAGTPYLVFQTYELHPSDVPDLPDDSAETTRRIEEYKRAHPDATFGWSAKRPARDESP